MSPNTFAFIAHVVVLLAVVAALTALFSFIEILKKSELVGMPWHFLLALFFAQPLAIWFRRKVLRLSFRDER